VDFNHGIPIIAIVLIFFGGKSNYRKRTVNAYKRRVFLLDLNSNKFTKEKFEWQDEYFCRFCIRNPVIKQRFGD